MASLTKEQSGAYRLQWTCPTTKRRKGVRVGKLTKRQAEQFRMRIERLIAAKASGCAIDSETAAWIAGLPDDKADAIAKAGLTERRERTTMTVSGICDEYIRFRADVKESTRTTYRRAKKHLVAYFGANCLLSEISEGDAEDWEKYLTEEAGLSEATTRKTCSIAKQFGQRAVKKRYVSENPFAELTAGTPANRDRDYFVTRDDAAKILHACPDAEWRLIFALSRFGGLRCPSEHLSLRWEHVLWDQNKLIVPSPKTEHHSDGAFRVMPLFPELRPHLEMVFDQTEEGAEHVISRYRSTNANLRTQFGKIISRAGLTTWPKLFQKLASFPSDRTRTRLPLACGLLMDRKQSSHRSWTLPPSQRR